MLTSSEALYNSVDRALELKLDIYFDGLEEDPMTITRDDYLIDASLLDEACANGDTYMGVPSANEFSATLFGSSGLFNPLNASSELYGKIRAGVPVKVYIRIRQLNDNAEEYSWDPLGVYFVSDWSSDLTGVTANIVATDKLADFTTDAITSLRVYKNTTYKAYIMAYFLANSEIVSVKADSEDLLPYGYINSSDSSFLSDISFASQFFIYCNHLGNIELRSIENNNGIAIHQLTDSNQIVSVTSKQSIVLDYTDAFVTTYLTSLSDIVTLIELNDVSIDADETIHYTNVSFGDNTLYALVSIKATCQSNINVTISNVIATSTNISFDVSCGSIGGMLNIVVEGYTLSTIKDESTGDESTKTVDCKYVESNARALLLKNRIINYLSDPFSILELEIRGNPFFEIGDIAHIISTVYNIDFTGIIIRQEYTYNGALSAKLTLLSSH